MMLCTGQPVALSGGLSRPAGEARDGNLRGGGARIRLARGANRRPPWTMLVADDVTKEWEVPAVVCGSGRVEARTLGLAAGRAVRTRTRSAKVSMLYYIFTCRNFLDGGIQILKWRDQTTDSRGGHFL